MFFMISQKSFGDYFSVSLKEFGEKFVSFLKVFLVFYLLPLFVLVLLGGLIFVGFFVVSNPFTMGGDVDLDIASMNIPNALLIPFVFVLIGFILLFFVFSILMTLGFLEIAFAKKPLTLSQTFKGTKVNFWRFLGLSIVMAVALFFLYLALIIPGVIFTVFWIFSAYVLVDKKTGVFDSLRGSYNIVKGRWWNVFGYSLLIMLIALVTSMIFSFVPFGGLVTTLVVTPIVIIFYKNWYLDLKGRR